MTEEDAADSRKRRINRQRREKSVAAKYVTRVGTTVNFYVPADKLRRPLPMHGMQAAADVLRTFLLAKFGGFTHEISHIQGYWVGRNGATIADQHERYEVSVESEAKADELFEFLSRLCALIEEQSIYLTYDGKTWLVKPDSKSDRSKSTCD